MNIALNEDFLEKVAAAAVVLAVVIAYVIKKRNFYWMKTLDFSPLVDEKLSQFGVNMIALRNPGRSDQNPFDRDSVKLAANYSNVKAMSEGESIRIAEYRVAKCYDSVGNQFDLWVQIDSELRITGERSVRFRSENAENLPPKVN